VGACAFQTHCARACLARVSGLRACVLRAPLNTPVLHIFCPNACYLVLGTQSYLASNFSWLTL